MTQETKFGLTPPPCHPEGFWAADGFDRPVCSHCGNLNYIEPENPKPLVSADIEIVAAAIEEAIRGCPSGSRLFREAAIAAIEAINGLKQPLEGSST
jgi:hypothetical protein